MPLRSRRRLSLSRRRPRRASSQTRRVTRRRRSRRSVSQSGRGVRGTLSGSYAMRGNLPGQPVTYRVGPSRPPNLKRQSATRNRILAAIAPVQKYSVTNWGGTLCSSSRGRFFIPGRGLFFATDRFTMATLSTNAQQRDTTRYTVKDATANTIVANMSEQIVHIRCYVCKARRDVPSSATTELGELVDTNDTIGPGGGMLYSGFTDNVSSNINIFEDPATTLFMNPRFTAYFKIQKVLNNQLAPGENKVYTVKVNRPTYVSNELYLSYNYMRGMPLLVFQIWGGIAQEYTPAQPTSDPPIPASQGGQVTTSQIRVDFVHKRHYNYQFVLPAQTKVFYENTLTSDTPLYHVNPDIAEIQPDANM